MGTCTMKMFFDQKYPLYGGLGILQGIIITIVSICSGDQTLCIKISSGIQWASSGSKG